MDRTLTGQFKSGVKNGEWGLRWIHGHNRQRELAAGVLRCTNFLDRKACGAKEPAGCNTSAPIVLDKGRTSKPCACVLRSGQRCAPLRTADVLGTVDRCPQAVESTKTAHVVPGGLTNASAGAANSKFPWSRSHLRPSSLYPSLGGKRNGILTYGGRDIVPCCGKVSAGKIRVSRAAHRLRISKSYLYRLVLDPRSMSHAGTEAAGYCRQVLGRATDAGESVA